MCLHSIRNTVASLIYTKLSLLRWTPTATTENPSTITFHNQLTQILMTTQCGWVSFNFLEAFEDAFFPHRFKKYLKFVCFQFQYFNLRS